MTYDVVIPTVGRPSLARLLDALAAQPEPLPERIWLVDDRPGRSTVPLTSHTEAKGTVLDRVTVLRSGGRGPAAARNAGWRASTADWIAFLDDDVVPPAGWTAALAADLDAAGPQTAGVQGRIVVPLPPDRRPTDWERTVKGLERAQWATADMAYRRAVLQQLGGFDERFRRNYREDADFGLRVVDTGWTIARGRRTIVHPVGPASPWVSLRAQAGNADDVLMRAIHGRDWRTRAGAPPGRLPRHALTAAAGLTSLAALSAGARRTATAAGIAWLTGTAELVTTRIAPGPKTPRELAAMALTSVPMPFVAVGQRLRGRALVRALRGAARGRPAAVLLDRDDTLILDVPYNGDPANVEPMPGAREAIERLRRAGIPTAVVSNQSGIGRGLLTRAEVEAVNARADELIGPLGAWLFCPHAPEDDCDCRKPAPGLIRQAASRLGVAPEDCVVIGDIGADVEAARAAGARAVLVPTPRTRPEEVAAAPLVAPDLATAIGLALAGHAGRPTRGVATPLEARR
ncbi:MAG TPA: HAD-IIIA family hydrolase [Conexibacter sp.]|nr:HAD-IIIA family hydrolase [Conexibacter sp.]